MFYTVYHMAPEVYNPGQTEFQGLSAMAQSGANIGRLPVNERISSDLGEQLKMDARLQSVAAHLSVIYSLFLSCVCSV